MEAINIRSPMRVKNNKLIAELELPGFKKNEVTVEPLHGGIQVSAVKRDAQTKDNKTHQSLRSHWRYFSLPPTARQSEMKYKFRHGKLTIKIPINQNDEDNDDDNEEEERSYERYGSAHHEGTETAGYSDPDFPDHWTWYRRYR